MNEKLLDKTFVGTWQNFEGTFSYFGSIYLNIEGIARLDVFNCPSDIYDNVVDENLSNVIGHFTETTSSKSFTIILNDGYMSRNSIGYSNNFSYKYKYALIAEYFVEFPEELRFSNMMISDPLFQKSCVTSDLSIDHSPNEKYVNYTLKLTEQHILHQNQDAKFYLWWRTNYPLTNESEISIKKHAWINLDFGNAKTLEDCLKELRSLEQFFIFLTKNVVSFSYLDVCIGKNTFSVYGLKPKYNNGFGTRNLNFMIANSEMLFTNWIEIKNRIDFALETFHEAYVHKMENVKNLFLSLCFSLELFHREFFKKFESYSDRYQLQVAEVTKILSGTPYYEWFINKVGNKKREISFQDRIRELITAVSLKPENYEAAEFSRKIRATRIKYVHLSDHEEIGFTEEELTENIRDIINLFVFHVNKLLCLSTKDVDEKSKFSRFLIISK